MSAQTPAIQKMSSSWPSTLDMYIQDGRVHVRDKFLTVQRPRNPNAAGLYECFVRALSFVGIRDWQSKITGFGCDGASLV